MCKNILKGAVCYLAGPIDYAHDFGVEYRQFVKEESKKRGLAIKYLDPTDKPEGLVDDVGVEQDSIVKFKEEGRWDELTALMKQIVRADLRQVDLSDFIIARVDTRIHSCGTYHEIVLADIEKKPVLLIVEGGKDKAPAWLYGIVDHTLMFNNAEECLEYLERINNGEIELDDRWVLFRHALENL
jgi:nucleoside 2-deoxyribosyltransferase